MRPSAASEVLELELPALYPWQAEFMGIDQQTGLPLPREALIPWRVASCGTKAGKGQPLDALIYTPSGPVKMGDLRIGQTVLSPDGPTTVEGIHPLGARELYRVTFIGGETVLTTDDHLWEVHSYRGRREQDRHRPWPRVLSTERLSRYTTELRRLWVPPVTDVEYVPQPVPIDPYLLGVLLGDGTLSQEDGSIRLTTPEEEILSAVRAALPKGYQVIKTREYEYRISLLQHHSRAEHRLIPILRTLGLWGRGSHEKSIPALYRYNSRHVRLQVLRGVLDTDGSVDKHGQPVFEQTSAKLADHVTEIIQSLGGYCRTTTKMGSYRVAGERRITRLVYRTRIRYADAPELFALTRKHVLCRPKKRGLPRKFRSIERMGLQTEAQCIRVSHERGLYLTNGMVPTHNSAGTSEGLVIRFLNEQVPCLWTAPVNKQLEPIWRKYIRPVFASLPKTKIRLIDSWGMWRAELRGTDAGFFLLSGEDPDSLRGASYRYAAIDEAGRYPKDSYDSVMTNLTDTDGVLFAISTPKPHGKGQAENWFTQEYREGLRQAVLGLPFSERTNASWKVPTNANPIPAVQRRFQVMQEKFGKDSYFFRTEYLGEVPEVDGSVFRRIATLHRSEPSERVEGHVYCYGWDPALTRDASVVSIWDVGERREVHLERLPMNDWRAQLERLRFLVTKYHLSRGRFDASSLGGQVTLDQLRSLGIPGEPVSFNQHTKPEIVQALALAMEAEEPRFLNDDLARPEMEHYTYTVLASGVVRYHASDGYHDDHVTARMLAWWDLTRGGLQIFFDEPEERAASPKVVEQAAGWQEGEDVEALFKRTGAWAGASLNS